MWSCTHISLLSFFSPFHTQGMASIKNIVERNRDRVFDSRLGYKQNRKESKDIAWHHSCVLFVLLGRSH